MLQLFKFLVESARITFEPFELRAWLKFFRFALAATGVQAWRPQRTPSDESDESDDF